MSVLIKGMKMPKDCNNCKFFDDNYDYPTCSVTDNSRGYNWNPRGQRMPDCPLIEVPPHGRLIDADAVLNAIKKAMEDDSEIADVYKEDYAAVSDWLYTAPTVIPADKDGET